MKTMCFPFALIALAVVVSLAAPAAQRSTAAQWQAHHDALRKRILDNGAKYPRGDLKASCSPYQEALGIAAQDRKEALAAAQEAQASKDPAIKAMFDRFMDLVDLAQDNGNTALRVADIILRVDDNFGPIGCAALCLRADRYGKFIYDEARRLQFDAAITQKQVGAMMDKAIQDLDEGWTLKCDGGYCGWMYPDRQRNANPNVEAMLKEGNMIREVSPYFGLTGHRQRADALMNRYLKDALCLRTDKSHQQYLDLARQFGLTDAAGHIAGFYATIKGTVYVDDGTGEKPARKAQVEIRDTKDDTTWTATADEEGRYEILKGPQHTHVGPNNSTRCPKFEIAADYEGARAEDTYEGPLSSPDPGHVFEKDLHIKPAVYDVSVGFNMTSPFVADGRMTLANLDFVVRFEGVRFQFFPEGNPLGGCCGVRARDGRGVITRIKPNDVQTELDERPETPRFTKGPPSEFTGALQAGMNVQGLRERSQGKPRQKAERPPETAPLVFQASFRPPIEWAAKVGSANFPSVRLEADVPWRTLIAGKPVSLQLPCKEACGEDASGTWTLTFTPQPRR